MPKRSSRVSKNDANDVCCVCIEKNKNVYSKIFENFVKINSRFIAIRDIILSNELKLIHYEVRLKLIVKWTAQNVPQSLLGECKRRNSHENLR